MSVYYLNSKSGGLNIESTWYGTIEQYDLIIDKDPNCLYLVNNDNFIIEEYIGRKRIFPQYPDAIVEYFYTHDVYSYDTGIKLFSSDVDSHDWEIIINLNVDSTSSERCALGCATSSPSEPAIELYVAGSRVLQFYSRSTGSSGSYNLGDSYYDKDIIFKKENGTLTITCEGTVLYSGTWELPTNINAHMYIGSYRPGYYYWSGLIKYVKFRYLT